MPPKKNKPVQSSKEKAKEYRTQLDAQAKEKEALAAENKFKCGGKYCQVSSDGRLLDEGSRIHSIEHLGAETDTKYCKTCTNMREHLK